MDAKRISEIMEKVKKVEPCVSMVGVHVSLYESLMEFELADMKKNGASDNVINYCRELYRKNIKTYINKKMNESE